MEESTNLQTLALETSVSTYPFTRRLLRSRTLSALMPILPYLRTGYQNPELQDVRQVSDENAISHDGIKSSDVVAGCLTRSEREDKLIHASVFGKSSKNVGCRDVDLGCKQIAQKQSDCMTIVMEEEQRPIQENINIMDYMVDDNQTEECDFLVQRPKDMVDLSLMGPVKLHSEFSLRDFSEVLNCSFDMDVDIELPKGIEVNKESGSVLKENIQKWSEQHLHITEMQLEKLISNPCEVDLLSCVDENKEVEEGEISGAAWVADELRDKLSEDVTSLGDKTTRVVYTAEDDVDGKALPVDEKKRIRWGLDGSDPAMSVANRGSDCKIGELRETAIGMPNHFQNVPHDRHREIFRFGSAAPRSKSIPSSCRTMLEYTDLNQDSPPSDGNDNKKKRKRGPLTKERKAKKKQKERIKRAENNQKLGIKRLKLQPEVKPKTIKYCRHYLQGRCHEGEKCKFSHDTVPSTKSKPCCHFARQSCMKGNNCPFDHELSKYPCNTYSSTGFCNRGANCLFSHKISAKERSPSTTSNVNVPNLKTEKSKMAANEGSFTALKVSKPSIKLISPPSNLYFSKSAGNNSTPNSHKVDPKLLAGEQISNKKKTPKGVSFLLPGDTSKPTATPSPSPSPKAVNGVVNKSILKTSPVDNTPSRPRGINFLSFPTKSSLDDTSSVKLSNLFLNGLNGKGKSVDESVNTNCQQIEVPSAKIQFNDSKISLLSNTPKAVQKSVQSTLAFAAKFQHKIKLNHTFVTGTTS